MGLSTLFWAVAVPPPFVVDGGMEPRQALTQAAERAWAAVEAMLAAATATEGAASLPSADSAVQPVRIKPAVKLPPAESGASRLGIIELRQSQPGVADHELLVSLRHEVAHQFLLQRCPAASDDRLFHEAFALVASGEKERWNDGRYLSTPEAHRLVQRGQLDTPTARRALARLLAESGQTWPAPMARRLMLCATDARWIPLALTELTQPYVAADALVVLSRHSGEVLRASGEASLPMPYGSTLKPFLLAGHLDAAPRLASDPRRPEWLCGDDLPPVIDARTALLRSCNGYFLDWAANDATAASLHDFAPLLVRLGLGRAPADMSEVLGIRPTLALSPWALAQAYRVLAAAHPELVALMRQNASEGTLAKLKASPALAAFATKTGTVRDSLSRPALGWLVAISDDLVVVKTVKGRQPRDFAAGLAKEIQTVAAGQERAEVQTFALLLPWQVEARCAGLGVARGRSLVITPSAFSPLPQLLEQGEAMCLGAPWSIRFPGVASEGRPYAGVFALLPAPRSDAGSGASAKQARARRGSDIVFTTSRARYTAGVLLAEDAKISGDARVALGRVIAHNVAHSRHPGRPVCDTTHCQVFMGTPAPWAGDDQIFAGVPPGGDWLLFSRGGSEPWEDSRSRPEVENVLGSNATGLVIADGQLLYRRTVAAGDSTYDESAAMPCDLLRSRLKLLSCPERIAFAHERFTFSGRGQGHGQGLDVEWAKRSGLSADEILRRAYGE